MAINLAVIRRVPEPPNPGRHPKASFVTLSGKRFEIPYAPRDTDLSGTAGDWTKVGRPGEPPLLYRSAKGLLVMSFDLVIHGDDFQEPIQHHLAALSDLARSGERMAFNYGPTEAVTWNMTKMDIKATERQHGTNLITEAVASIELTQAQVPGLRVGPVSGGVKVSVAPPPKPAPVDNRPRVTFKRGDTLWGFAVKHYGNGNLWPRIADANGIRDPRKIPVGFVAVIP